jgi:hypothetical protein
MAFWKMLKKGNDHFEVSKLEPKVNVCEKRYVFDAESPTGRPLSFNPAGKCPEFQVPDEIASGVNDKQRKDEHQTAELIRRGTPTAPIKTYADGGMNKVFVAAVKNNQIGVAPQESLFVTTAPGTIPATVRPPRIPELAGAPVVAGVAPAAHPDGEVAPQQMAIADTTSASKPAAKSNSMFGSLFSSSSADKKSEGPLDRVARLVGLGRKSAETPAVAPPPAPKPKPVAKPVSVAAHGAIRPKQASAEPVTTAQSPSPGVVTAAATAPRAPAVQVAPASTTMSGSAPVVPVGSFDSRWSAFR